MKWNLENRKLADLKPFKRNPRTFTKKGMSDLKQSIDKFGLCEPIIIQPSGLVIGGHARLDILKKSGVKEVDVYVAENELSEEEFKINKNNAGDYDNFITFALWLCGKTKYGFADIAKRVLRKKRANRGYLNIALKGVGATSCRKKEIAWSAVNE